MMLLLSQVLKFAYTGSRFPHTSAPGSQGQGSGMSGAEVAVGENSGVHYVLDFLF